MTEKIHIEATIMASKKRANKSTEQRKAEIAAERQRKLDVYNQNLADINGRVAQREKEKAELPLTQLEKQELLLDEYVAWLADNNTTHPNWNDVVSKYHAVCNRIAVLTAVKPNFGSGIREFSTVGINQSTIRT